MSESKNGRPASGSRQLEVVVLGVSVEDGLALVETRNSSQEQFVVKRWDAGEDWPAPQVNAVVSIIVTSERFGRVLEVRSGASS